MGYAMLGIAQGSCNWWILVAVVPMNLKGKDMCKASGS